MSDAQAIPLHTAAVFTGNLRASLPTESGEALSIFWSGALAGLSLETAVHGCRVLEAQRQQRQFRSLDVAWWLRAITSPAKPKGPYQGAVGTLAAGTIWSGIFGSVYVPVRAAVDATVPPEEPWWGPAVAAAAGSVAASSVRVPKQVVKARMERGEFFCSLQAFERILLREGPAGLYRGWLRSVAKNAPFDAVLFLLYDTGKSSLMRSRELRQPQPAVGPGSSAQLQQVAGFEATVAATRQEALAASGGRGDSEAEYQAPSPNSLPVPPAGALAPTLATASATASAAPRYDPWDAALIGGAAGAVSSLLTSPLELIRQTWQERAMPGTAVAVSQASPASAGRRAAAPAPTAMPVEPAASAPTSAQKGRGTGTGLRGAGIGLVPAAPLADCTHAHTHAHVPMPAGVVQTVAAAAEGLSPQSVTATAEATKAAKTAQAGARLAPMRGDPATAQSGGGGGGVGGGERGPAACATGPRPAAHSGRARTLLLRLNPVGSRTASCATGGMSTGGGGGGGCGASGAWARWRFMAGSVRSRVLWSALEGAVFFPSLELAIPLCDWLFLPPPGEGDGEASAAAGSGAAEAGWGQGPLRHPAHPLHW